MAAASPPTPGFVDVSIEGAVGVGAINPATPMTHECVDTSYDSEFRSVASESNSVGDIGEGRIPVGRPPGDEMVYADEHIRRVHFSPIVESRDYVAYLSDALQSYENYPRERGMTQDYLRTERYVFILLMSE